MVRHAAPLLASLILAAPAAAEAPPFPNPLTLEQALAYADADHPDLALAEAHASIARARALDVDARFGTRAYADLTPEWVEPASGGRLNDSRARVIVTKPLYDFGRQLAYREAAAASVAGGASRLLDARAQRRLAIMERFFDVRLADMHYAVLNEDLAQRFIAFDRARERHNVGQLSDVDVAAAESQYRETLDQRTDAQKRQTSARLRLALALGRHDALPRELAAPALPANARDIPATETVYAEALKANPRLRTLHHELDAARAALGAEQARRRPVLSAELEAAEYERTLASRNDLRATLNLRVPLYQGGEVEAQLARAAAELHLQQARVRQAEHETAQAALELVQRLEALKVKRDSAQQRIAYRDMYLDRARAFYEMEVRTDLGDAQTRLTEALWLAARIDYEIALTWAKLDALTGNLVSETKP